jgi:seryl-tRNA synthetase
MLVMGGFSSALDRLPPWMGSVPAWTTLVMVVGYIIIQWIKTRPAVLQHQIQERLNVSDSNLERIKHLEAAVRQCQLECEQHKTLLNKKCETLQERLNNEAMQRVQSEISLVNTLIQVVDAPQLKIILAALEARQTRMLKVEIVEQ